MDTMPRFVDWGHWGLTFWIGERGNSSAARAIASLPFGVGPTGPVDGTLGSPRRERYHTICRIWTDLGDLPEGARCDISAAWLYDPACPKARWVEGYGWQSPVRVPSRGWTFPEIAQ